MTDDISSALRAVDDVVGGPGLFRSLDAATRAVVEPQLQWTWLNGGDVLFRQGDVGDAMYMVITGKLEALVETAGRDEEVLGDISRGEWVGEMAVLTGDPRSATIRAKRDSSLVKFSRDAFERTTLANPQAMLAMTRGIVRRLRERDLSSAPPPRVATIEGLPERFISASRSGDFRTNAPMSVGGPGGGVTASCGRLTACEEATSIEQSERWRLATT